MKNAVFLVVTGLLFSLSAQAEMFKCMRDGRATYQASPCLAGKESAVDIKIKDPDRDAEHQAKLKALESEVAEKRRQADAQALAQQPKPPAVIMAPAMP